MRIKIIGPEKDPAFKELLSNILHAVHQLQIEATVDEVTDLKEIAENPLTLYPTIYIDGQLVCQGKSISLEQVKECIRRFLERNK